MSFASLPPFLKHLWTMVDDPNTDHIISWSTRQPNVFVVKDIKAFEKILTNYFKHNKYASFVRQLNMYDFQKVHDNRSSVYSIYSGGAWSHPNFCRNQKHRIFLIKRRTSAEVENRTHLLSSELAKVNDHELRLFKLEEELMVAKNVQNMMQNQIMKLDSQLRRYEKIFEFLFKKKGNSCNTSNKNYQINDSLNIKNESNTQMTNTVNNLKSVSNPFLNISDPFKPINTSFDTNLNKESHLSPNSTFLPSITDPDFNHVNLETWPPPISSSLHNSYSDEDMEQSVHQILSEDPVSHINNNSFLPSKNVGDPLSTDQTKKSSETALLPMEHLYSSVFKCDQGLLKQPNDLNDFCVPPPPLTAPKNNVKLSSPCVSNMLPPLTPKNIFEPNLNNKSKNIKKGHFETICVSSKQDAVNVAHAEEAMHTLLRHLCSMYSLRGVNGVFPEEFSGFGCWFTNDINLGKESLNERLIKANHVKSHHLNQGNRPRIKEKTVPWGILLYGLKK